MPKASKISKKISALLILFTFIFQQLGFAQVAGQINISGFMQGLGAMSVADKFRPLHMRYFSYDTSTDQFSLIVDKGDLKNKTDQELEGDSEELLKYFLVGITLPDSAFWVNLRPDGIQQIIDPELSKTDVGKIFLEADLQLKKDTARLTSPETPEGREYWDKLYKKAGELFGTENITIPTLTRPWIVPGDIIIRETEGSAFVYKASLKVMLEQDHLKDSAVYNFKDERLKQLNEYSSQVIRETILPKLTREVNLSKKYAPLRQVFYSLALARWFKARFAGKPGVYPGLIDSRNLAGLTSKESWSVNTYFEGYKKSFNDGEYNIKEPVYAFSGQSIRSYFSGGIAFGPENLNVSSSPALGGFRGRDNMPLAHSAFGSFMGRAAFSPSHLEVRAESLRRRDKPDERGLPYLMPQLRRNLEGFVGGERKSKAFDKEGLQEIARTLTVSDSNLAVILNEVDDASSIPVSVKVENKRVRITTGVINKKKVQHDPGLEEELRKFLSTTASSPVMTKTQAQIKDILIFNVHGKGKVKFNIEQLAKDFSRLKIPVNDKQACFDLAALACGSLFVGVTPDPNDKYVYISDSELFRLDEGWITGLHAAEPQNMEASRSNLENALRAKLGFPPEAPVVSAAPSAKAQVTARVTLSASKFSASEFTDSQWRKISDLLVAKQATLEEFAQWLAYVDRQEPYWHVFLDASAGKFRIVSVTPPVLKRMKDVVKVQNETNRYQAHLAVLKNWARMSHFVNPAIQASSPTPVQAPGGIDFRAMNLIIQPMGSLSGLNFRLPNSPELARMDLDREEAELNKMVEAGIVPSGERLKEYLAACHYRDETDERMEGLISCLIQACRLEEEQVVESTPEFKEALVIADSGKFSLN